MVTSVRRAAFAASAVLLVAADCVSAATGGLRLHRNQERHDGMPTGVTASDVMTGLSHCLDMSRAFHLPHAAEPSFGVLNHQRGARLADAGVNDRAQLWIFATGFEDAEPSGDFAFDADATSYNHVESFPANAANYGSVDMVCGANAKSMKDVAETKRRVHTFDASTASKFAELFPRESGLFSSSDKADKEFMTEIVGMYECADKIAHGASRKIIMSLRALEDVLIAHGVSSSQYEAAKTIFGEAVRAVQDRFATKHEDGVSGVVTVPAHLTSVKRWMQNNLSKRSIPSAQWRSNGLSTDPRIAALQVCAPDAASCAAVSLGCSGHGTCVKTAVIVANASAIATAERDKVAEAKFCYVCDCNVVNLTNPIQWTGDFCQYQEISSQFNLLFWSTVILLVILILTLHVVFKSGEKQD